MKQKSMTRSLLNDNDLNTHYLTERLWEMINSDGKVDEVEREYYAAILCKLQFDKKKN